MEAPTMTSTTDRAKEILTEGAVLFTDLEAIPDVDDYPRGGVMTCEGEGWYLWIAGRKTYAVVLGTVYKLYL